MLDALYDHSPYWGNEEVALLCTLLVWFDVSERLLLLLLLPNNPAAAAARAGR
jgi:hypothetical protein